MSEPRTFFSTSNPTDVSVMPITQKKTIALGDPASVLELYDNDEKMRLKLKNPALVLPRTLIESLQKKGLPGVNIKSLYINEPYTVFEQYLGSYCYNRFNELKASPDNPKLQFYLDKACEFKFFSALVVRMAANQKILKSSYLELNVGQQALTQLAQDTLSLTNNYWTLGFLHAALIHLDIGNYLANQGNLGGGDEYQKIALKNFLRAKELSKYSKLPDKHKIEVTICGKRSLDEVFNFRGNWDVAENFFLAHYRPNAQMAMNEKLYVQMREQAQVEINARAGRAAAGIIKPTQ